MGLASEDKKVSVPVIADGCVLETRFWRCAEKIRELYPLERGNGHVGEWLGVDMEKT